MRIRWLWIFVIVSLVANFGFVGGYVGASLQRDATATPSGALQMLVERLGLGSQQVDSLNRHRGTAAIVHRELERTNRPDIEMFWAELLKDKPDGNRLRTMTQAIAARQVTFTLSVAEELRAFMADLDPKQQQAFADLIRERPIFQGRFLMTTSRAGQPGS